MCKNRYCNECVRWNMTLPEYGHPESMRLCLKCFTEIFCIECEKCKKFICYRCENPLHNVNLPYKMFIQGTQCVFKGTKQNLKGTQCILKIDNKKVCIYA